MNEEPTRRLILVSNRLPFQLNEKSGKVLLKESDGGLVSALKSFFDREGDQSAFSSKKWIGAADFSEKRWEKFSTQPHEKRAFEVDPIFIEKKVYNKYYNGFCNATLWPLFHYFPSYVEYDDEAFKSYEEVNRIFADKIIASAKHNDVVWIHDYQLFLVPEMIREQLPHATIGFFLHIPFPTFEVFRLLHRPWKEKIINGMLGADLIGFHTHEYVQHFLKTVGMVTQYDHQYRSILHSDRSIKADLFPLGIDYDKFHDAILREEIIQEKNSILKNFSDKKIIFSVDRLDYTKGITHRLTGFERLLELHPEWKEKIVFILVVVPSREIISKYNERLKLIEELVGSINGRYSTLSWQPIIYRYNHLSFTELSALYQAAHIGLITPLRDGMNLVAKEYVASRENASGVLILSELAGAASEMGEATLVNPMDKNEVADAIHRSLMSTVEEQQRNMKLLQHRLTEYNVVDWVKDFLSQLDEVKELQHSQNTNALTRKKAHELARQFKQSSKRCIFLDYDGTLVPFAKHPREAMPGKDLIALLTTLTANQKNEVIIISGRDSVTLEEWFNELPVTLVAEHGASTRLKGQEWTHEALADQSWKTSIKPTLELFFQRSPRSFIEEKNHTLAWHYRNVEAELGFIRSRELLDNLYHLVRNAQLQVIDGNKVIEVRVAGVDKGSAAVKLTHDKDYDFIIIIGDDKTDEDMFRIMADKATCIKVGSGNTVAQFNLPTQHDVIPFLNQLIE